MSGIVVFLKAWCFLVNISKEREWWCQQRNKEGDLWCWVPPSKAQGMENVVSSFGGTLEYRFGCYIRDTNILFFFVNEVR